MNIKQALQQASHIIEVTTSGADITDTRLDASVLLTHVLKCNSAHLAAWPEKDLDDDQGESFLNMVKLRAQGTPIAHLTGTREFWSLEFETDDSTLIPRAETETLVEYILEKFSEKDNLSVLDMGTGTGAIAIALATEKPGWDITGCDISSAAVKLATRNSKKHGVQNTRFINSDWFERFHSRQFDIIVSNPPYIADDDPHLQQGDVRFEPRSALTSGSDGMDDIKHLCNHARQHLNDDGYLVIEHGYDQQQLVSDSFTENSFNQIETRQDLSGHTRMTAGKL